MNKKVLKSIGLILLSTMLFTNCYGEENSISEEKDDVIILHNLYSEFDPYSIDPLQCIVIPLVDIELHKYPDYNSQVIGKLPADALGIVTSYEIHTYPGRYPFEEIDLKNNKIQGFLLKHNSYEWYYALVDNKITMVQLFKSKPRVEYDTWLCIKNDDGFEGWTRSNPSKDRWKKSPSFHVFFQKATIGSRIEYRDDIDRYLYLRSYPGEGNNVIGEVNEYETVAILEEKKVDGKKWSYVQRKNGEKGWFFSERLRKVDVKTNSEIMVKYY